jgi:hypothetical protein
MNPPDVSIPIFRPSVPISFQKQVFEHVHSLGHPGIQATRRLLSSRFVWSHMAADIAIWTCQCLACQKAKIHTHIAPPATAIPIPECRFAHIHVDIVGPLPPSQGFTHIFTIVDRTTRWEESVPLSSLTASACADALCSTWIARFSVPHTITLDRGTRFTSALWSHLTSFLQIEHITTTAFHPQSNRIVERFHHCLKDTLRACCTTLDWVGHLPWFLFSFRSTPHEKSNLSPAEATFGSPLVLPAQFPVSPHDDSFHFPKICNAPFSGSFSPPPTDSPPPPLASDLLTAPFVFICASPSHPPLSPS